LVGTDSRPNQGAAATTSRVQQREGHRPEDAGERFGMLIREPANDVLDDDYASAHRDVRLGS